MAPLANFDHWRPYDVEYAWKVFAAESDLPCHCGQYKAQRALGEGKPNAEIHRRVRDGRGCRCPRAGALLQVARLGQLGEQGLGRAQIGCVEPFREPTVDFAEHLARLTKPALLLP